MTPPTTGTLTDEWVRFLDRWYAPLRYPVHGLQMLAAYVAQMAPASRVTNCAAFQSADELRRVQRLAYRTAQLGGRRPGSRRRGDIRRPGRTPRRSSRCANSSNGPWSPTTGARRSL